MESSEHFATTFASSPSGRMRSSRSPAFTETKPAPGSLPRRRSCFLVWWTSPLASSDCRYRLRAGLHTAFAAGHTVKKAKRSKLGSMVNGGAVILYWTPSS